MKMRPGAVRAENERDKHQHFYHHHHMHNAQAHSLLTPNRPQGLTSGLFMIKGSNKRQRLIILLPSYLPKRAHHIIIIVGRAKAQWVGLALIGKTLSKSKVTLLLLLLAIWNRKALVSSSPKACSVTINALPIWRR